MTDNKKSNDSELNALRALRKPGRVIHYRSMFERELEGPSESSPANALETEEAKDQE